jgi:DNA-binding GntR family transcriptional regulator
MSRASERAYQEIRSRILTGALPPGAQLKEEELADVCGVSRTPVRDALRRLEAEMFIRRTESQRTFVADWSVDDIDEAFALRGMLEGHAAERAATRITPKQIAELKALNDGIEAAIGGKRPNVEQFLAFNREFHAVLLEAAGSERLTMILGKLVEQPIVLRTALLYDRAQLERSHREHAELLAALDRRDPDWSKAVMTGHIRRAFHAYADAYSRHIEATSRH